MSDSLLSRFALAALAATFLVPAANCAFAQTAGSKSSNARALVRFASDVPKTMPAVI